MCIKNYLCIYKHIKSATGAVQTLNCIACKIKIYSIQTPLYFDNINEFPQFFHINFLIYLRKNLFMQIKHIKSTTDAMQTLNDVLHIK